MGIWKVDSDGQLPQVCWLFLYNMAQKTLGSSGTSTQTTITQITADLDADVDSTDFLPLFQRVANLERGQSDALVPANVPAPEQFDALVSPIPLAQPVQTLTVGASPYTYQALADGAVIINGGTVSAVQVSRDGLTYYTVTSNMVPVSRLDSVQITYSVAPTAVFFPR